ncbi:type II toxin-antitoxin system Phd/YefM family antitoxin [Streptomyces sp. NPDC093225]|uniref:type II toxin-antitoxin system Phd/YefM family antitoxin n=1 Tax=Streptomyces sp. NPDC093225 TaxID=3366034 RepID=UPI003825E117
MPSAPEADDTSPDALVKRVHDDRAPLRISPENGDAVLMPADDYDAWQETVYLLRSPANARRLMEAVARDRAASH